MTHKIYKFGALLKVAIYLATFLFITFFSNEFNSIFYFPFQAAQHESIIPYLLIFFSGFYVLLYFGKLNAKIAYLVGVVQTSGELLHLFLRCYLVRTIELSAFFSICILIVALLLLIAGLKKHRNNTIKPNIKKVACFLLVGYVVFSNGFYPLTYLLAWINKPDIQLSSLPFDKKPQRFKLSLTNDSCYSAYYGEMHGHTIFSIDARIFGAGHPDEYFVYARDIAGLDFCALTEHDSPNGIADNPEQWRYLVKLTEEFNTPGKFITFNAFEWTSGEGHDELFHNLSEQGRWEFLEDNSVWGHRNIFFSDSKVPSIPFSHNHKESDTPEEVWLKMDKYKTIAIPHHPLGGPVPPLKWDHYSEKHEPLVELYSYHGNSEAIGAAHQIYNAYADENGNSKHSVQYALNQHYHFGLIGSTDTHTGWGGNFTTHPEHSKPEKVMDFLFKFYKGKPAMGGGLTGVFATDLTRKSIWDALEQKRTFATTGPRMAVAIKANETFMGQILEVSDTNVVLISAEAYGTCKLLMVELIKNGETIKQIDQINDNQLKFSLADTVLNASHNYYYIRVTQADNEMAWSSPVWVVSK